MTIAHRLSTIIGSDRIAVLSFGQLKEYDTPTNLLARDDSEFKKLVDELEEEKVKADDKKDEKKE